MNNYDMYKKYQMNLPILCNVESQIPGMKKKNVFD